MQARGEKNLLAAAIGVGKTTLSIIHRSYRLAELYWSWLQLMSRSQTLEHKSNPNIKQSICWLMGTAKMFLLDVNVCVCLSRYLPCRIQQHARVGPEED